MGAQVPYDELLEELLSAIELREDGDPDVRDWAIEARIRRLERQLLERRRYRPRTFASEAGAGQDAVLAAAGLRGSA